MTGLRDTPSGGTGLLAIFCDLDEADRADFRPWLTEDMFPARRAIGFNACASYDRVDGDGQQFLTLYEMPSLGHLYGEPYQALRRNRNPRDAMYHRKFRNPDRYTFAWTGPEFARAGVDSSGLAEFIRVDRFDLPGDVAQEFNIRFVGDFLPALGRVASIVRARRYLAMEGSPTHVLVTEFEESPADVGVLPAGANAVRTATYRQAAAG